MLEKFHPTIIITMEVCLKLRIGVFWGFYELQDLGTTTVVL